jgi:hypothetical protein
MANQVTIPPAFESADPQRHVVSTGGIAHPVWAQPLQLVKHAFRAWRRGRLSRARQKAQLALGERMCAAGIDDGTLGRQLAALEDELRQAQGNPVVAKALESERTSLLLRLAELALEDAAPLPGAELEHRRAMEAEAALDALAPVK